MKMDVCIIGTGTYVSGRGTDGYGTILPAISAYQKELNSLSRVFVVGTNVQRTQEAEEKIQKLSDLTGVLLPLKFFPDENDSAKSYLHALGQVKLPACAIVALPDHLHYEVASACLEKGLHTLVVKPLTPTVTEAEKLVRHAKNNNVYGAVEFHKRWDRQNRILRDEYQSGRLGIPLYTWTEYSQRKSIPSQVFHSWVEKTNILQYLGIHYVDIIRFVTGAVPVKVMATGQKKWLKGLGLDVYDAIQSMVEWETPEGHIFNQTLLVNWIDPENSSSMSDQKLKFVGTKGRYEGDQKERGVRLLYDDQVLQEPNPDFCRSYKNVDGFLAWEGYGIDSIVSFLGDVESLNSGRCTLQELEGKRPTFSESILTTAVIEAAEESLKNNSNWIDVNV
jgi:D-galacturonate reductase